MNTITVIGSINFDRTIRVKYMPKPGETLHTKEIFSAGGGKGANQAVAAQRSGAETHFIGAVGNDSAGDMLKGLLEDEGIDLTGVQTLEKQATGRAYIVVDDDGENSIMIHSGANGAFTPEDVAEHHALIENSDFVVGQFESALDSTIAAFKTAHTASVKTILNPAPARENIPEELLALTDVIAPNETETEILTGIKVTDINSLKQAAEAFHHLGVEVVIITIGSKGAFYSVKDGESDIIPALQVTAVDTTAAGDTFIGAMTSVLEGDLSNLREAIKFGNKASALTVQRYGAQPSIPYLKELKKE